MNKQSVRVHVHVRMQAYIQPSRTTHTRLPRVCQSLGGLADKYGSQKSPLTKQFAEHASPAAELPLSLQADGARQSLLGQVVYTSSLRVQMCMWCE